MKKNRNVSPCYDGEDRISRLPDNLIHHIMSFNDAKYAVQTSVLSKRWIHTWKSLPCLNFKWNSFSDDKLHSFIMFVDMVLICRRKDVDIQRLRVHWEKAAYHDSVALHVNRWCLFAVEYNVQDLKIVISQRHNSAYVIPHCLLNCKSLRKLSIELCVINARYADIILPISMNLPRLKVMHLIRLSISNAELWERLLSSCPVLETLGMCDCDIQTGSQRNLIVDSVSLKKFQYFQFHRRLLPQKDTKTKMIKLCAPNLEELKCKFFWTQDYSLQNFSPLSRVCFNMLNDGKDEDENAEAYSRLPSTEKAVYVKRVMNFLGAVSMVKELTLSSGFLEVLSQAPDILNSQPPRLRNLYCLSLDMWCTKGCLRAIAYLLKISPGTTQLLIESKKSNLADVGDDWEAGLSSPGMLSHLNLVQIEDVEGCDAEFKLLSFLLKNAKVLEEVILFFGSGVGSPPGRARQVEQFKNKLRAVPTASSSVQWFFET